MVQLSGQHRLQKIVSIGYNNAVAIEVAAATSRRDLLEGEQLKSGLGVEEFLRVLVLGISEAGTYATSELRKASQRGQESRRVAS